MVAGVSSRFGGKIKAFAKVGPKGETLIEYSLEQALPAGFSQIVFIVGNTTEAPFKKMFGRKYLGLPVEYAKQQFNPAERDKPWGTGNAVSVLRGIIKSGFVICNGDDLYDEAAFRALYNHLNDSDECAAIGYKLIENLPEKGIGNRGIFKCNRNGYVIKIEEVLGIDPNNLAEKGLKPSDLASMNIFALNAKVVSELAKRFNAFKKTHKSDRKIEFFSSQRTFRHDKKTRLEN